MKLSRRGKSARRRRHTKRTGKHLRCRGKKVSGSKRYHRIKSGRGHTKKTYGGRVKRGGVGDDPWKTIEWTDVADNPSEKQATGLLVYKKDSTFSLTSESKYFRVTLKPLPQIRTIITNTRNEFSVIESEVFMERYEEGQTGPFDKTFTVYFAFGYIPQRSIYSNDTGPPLSDNYYFVQYTDETGNNTVIHSIRTQGKIIQTDLMPVSVFDGSINHIALPKEFSNIIGYNPDNTKSDKYIFYGDNKDRKNYYFFKSLATEMYNILETKRAPPATAASQ